MKTEFLGLESINKILPPSDLVSPSMHSVPLDPASDTGMNTRKRAS